MKPNILNKAILFTILLFVGFQAFSQNHGSNDFYKHFTGKLDSTMNLTLDLLSHNGIVNGYYYYSFPEPGSTTEMHYGKTISISGTISKESINFREFNNTESQFSGTLENDNKISGLWQKSAKDKTVPFFSRRKLFQWKHSSFLLCNLR